MNILHTGKSSVYVIDHIDTVVGQHLIDVELQLQRYLEEVARIFSSLKTFTKGELEDINAKLVAMCKRAAQKVGSSSLYVWRRVTQGLFNVHFEDDEVWQENEEQQLVLVLLKCLYEHLKQFPRDLFQQLQLQVSEEVKAYQRILQQREGFSESSEGLASSVSGGGQDDENKVMDDNGSQLKKRKKTLSQRSKRSGTSKKSYQWRSGEEVIEMDKNLAKYRQFAGQQLRKRKTAEEVREEAVQKMAQALAEKEKKVHDLERAVELRSEEIKQLTVQYMRDLVHLKEMKVLQNMAEEKGEIKAFEVKFLDEVNALDKKSKMIVDEIVSDLKHQCDKRINQLYLQLKKFEIERDEYREKYETGRKGKDVLSLLKTFYDLEKSPYVLWKCVQDVFGTENVFRVFEERNGGHGINYTLIDHCLIQSAAVGRELAEQKKLADEQHAQLVISTRAEIEALHSELAERDQQLRRAQENADDELFRAKQEIESDMRSLLREKEFKLFKEFEEQVRTIQRELFDQGSQAIIEKLQKTNVLLQWRSAARIMLGQQRQKELEQALRNCEKLIFKKSTVNAQQRINQQQSATKLEEAYQVPSQSNQSSIMRQLMQYNEQINQLMLENQGLKDQVSRATTRSDRVLNEANQLRQYLQNVRQNKREIETRYNILRKAQDLIREKLNLTEVELIQAVSKKDENPREQDAQKVANKKLVKKIQEVGEKERKVLSAIVEGSERSLTAYSQMVGKNVLEVSCLTEIHNIKFSLQELELRANGKQLDEIIIQELEQQLKLLRAQNEMERSRSVSQHQKSALSFKNF